MEQESQLERYYMDADPLQEFYNDGIMEAQVFDGKLQSIALFAATVGIVPPEE